MKAESLVVAGLAMKRLYQIHSCERDPTPAAQKRGSRLLLNAGGIFLYVNQQGESRVLRDTPWGTWGVPSPDGSKLAFVDKAVDSNVWMWQIEGGR
jgi:hypothetical protein